MILEFQDLVIAYFIPIIAVLIFIILAVIVLNFISKLGEKRGEDPAARALHRRRRRH